MQTNCILFGVDLSRAPHHSPTAFLAKGTETELGQRQVLSDECIPRVYLGVRSFQSCHWRLPDVCCRLDSGMPWLQVVGSGKFRSVWYFARSFCCVGCSCTARLGNAPVSRIMWCVQCCTHRLCDGTCWAESCASRDFVHAPRMTENRRANSSTAGSAVLPGLL